MMRSRDAILQELAREKEKFAELELARKEARGRIESLRSELAAAATTTPPSLPQPPPALDRKIESMRRWAASRRPARPVMSIAG